MVILMVVSGSMSFMSLMSGTMGPVVWFRRIMIIATLLTAGYTLYQPIRHKCKSIAIISVTVASGVISIGFSAYSLVTLGW